MDIADHSSVAVCWNCNTREALAGEGLEHNFSLVKDRLGATLHIHELSGSKYPYPQLFKLLAKANYKGWALLECSSKPKDAATALRQQREAFDRLCSVTWPAG